MTMSTTELARDYYTAVGTGDFDKVASYLHPDVEFSGPMATLQGREAVVQATHNFMRGIATLKIRTVCSSEDQAVVVYETDIPGVDPEFPGASWLTFRDGQVVRIQLFYDASRMVEKKDEIFN